MNKSGVVSMPLIIIILLVASISMIMLGFVWGKFNTFVQGETAFQDNSTQEALANTTQTFSNFDITMFSIFIGFVIVVIITSYLIRTNSIFVVVMIIFLVLLVVFSMIISNVWDGIVTGDIELQTSVETNYPRTNFIMNNLPILIFITDIMALIALFAKRGGEGSL